MFRCIIGLLVIVFNLTILFSQNNTLDYYYQNFDPSPINWISTGDLSGITCKEDRLFMIEDGGGVIGERNQDLLLLRTIYGADFGDAEDIVYLGQNEFAIVNESGELFIGNIPDGSFDLNININDFQRITFFQHNQNDGPEGVAYDQENSIFYIVKEKNPMTIFSFNRPSSSSDTIIIPDIPFSAEEKFYGIMEDLSSITYDYRTNRLLILSDETHRLIDVNPLTGDIYSILNIDNMEQPEGVSFINENYDLIIVGEPNYFIKYGNSLYTISSNDPRGPILFENYPNPFNPITTLRYELLENTLVNITIYNILGRPVKTLIDKVQDAGNQLIIWDSTNNGGKPLSAGIYLCQIQAGEYKQTMKMILAK